MSPMFMFILFMVIGICLIVSGGIIVGSVKKFSNDATAQKNIENVGIFMNILPGIAALLAAAYFYNASRTIGVMNEISPIVLLVLGVIFGLCLTISGGIVLGSVKKLTGNDTASSNITRTATWLNLIPGLFILVGTVGMYYMKNRDSSQGRYSPSPSPSYL